MDSSQPRIGLIVLSGLVAITLQLVVAPVITIFGVVPNFVLVAAIIIAMRNGSIHSTIAGFLLGLVFDLCSSGPMGAMTLVLTVLCFAVGSFSKEVFSGGIIVDLIVLVASIALGELLVSVIYAVVGVNPAFLLSLVQRVLPGILYDAIIGCIFLLIFTAAQGGRSAGPGRSMGTGRSLSRKLNR
ncbi:MAG: rod shape-determining protein MreD [Coriobacteriales bacterium]|jgi:rod shape-determining protein MreD|nr:rod shape-determining protein MreD [Coriobacteriales bacterium]